MQWLKKLKSATNKGKNMRVQETAKIRGPYKSTRLKNIETEWSDVEFLMFVKHQHELRTRKPEIIEAFQKRIDSIIQKLGESK